MKALTIRNVDPRLAAALARETKRRSTSLNQTVLDVLRRGLGIDDAAPRTNGLEKLAGTWTAKEFDEFEANVAIFDDVDPELWRSHGSSSTPPRTAIFAAATAPRCRS